MILAKDYGRSLILSGDKISSLEIITGEIYFFAHKNFFLHTKA